MPTVIITTFNLSYPLIINFLINIQIVASEPTEGKRYKNIADKRAHRKRGLS